jgi:pro-kumamolisin-like protein/Big-like domain-containing protein
MVDPTISNRDAATFIAAESNPCVPCRLQIRSLRLLLAFITLIATGLTSASAQTSDVILGDRQIIARSTHPLTNAAEEIGVVNGNKGMDRMVLILGVSTEQDHQLQTLIDSQHSKGSPEYHHWLTPDEFGNRFGPTEKDIAQVKSWLQEQGFVLGRVARSGRWIEFSGSVAQVEAAFQTQMRQYRVAGMMHTANAGDISIPSSLSQTVRGVLSLHDFVSKPMLTDHYKVRRDSSGALIPVDPNFTVSGLNGNFHFLAPRDYANIYGVSSLYKTGLDGTGQTIAIVARSNIDFADVEIFRQVFGLPFNDPNVIISGPDPEFAGDDAVETTLDVEWSGAVAPKATVDLVIAASTTTTDGVALSASYIVDNNLAGVMSISYGACEEALGGPANAFYNALWQQAAAQGISVVVAAGDNGSAGCDAPADPNNMPAQRGLAVNGIASTVFDTAVGGTKFAENGNESAFWSPINASGFSSVAGYIPETVWNESCDPTKSSGCRNNAYNLFAGSGGASQLYTKPSWQSGMGVPADGHRDLPDVSLAAAAGHDGYLICLIGSCLTTPDGNLLKGASVVGGTSASAPSFAGILALVGQKLGVRQGLANYELYRLAAKDNLSQCNSSARIDPAAASECIFNDTTSGDNSVPGQIGFTALTGFDLATGLGSVNAGNLANAWSSAAFQGSVTVLTVPPSPAAHGQAIQVTVDVSASNGGGRPSGNFALISDKYGAVGAAALTNGSFSGTFSSLPGGQYNLTAHYPGDADFGSSDSPPVSVSIGQENSTLALSSFTYSSTGPSPTIYMPYGNFLYLHSTVTSASGNGIATGTITYQEGSTVLGTITLNSKGEAELVSGGFPELGAVIFLTVGTHVITAKYSGDNSLLPSLSQPLFVTITKATPAVFFQNATPVSLNPTEQALLVGFVSNTGPILPTGTVQFLDGGIPLGPPVTIAPLLFPSRPEARLQISLSPGMHTITLGYSGDEVYDASQLKPPFFPLIVNVTTGSGTATQTTLVSGASSTTVGQVLNYTATVGSSRSAPLPTGTIQIFEPGIGPPNAPVNLQNGTATIPIQWGFAGAHSVIAQYSGDSNYATSTSSPVTVLIAKATPSINLAASAPIVKSGTQVSLTSQVATSVRPIVTGLVGLAGQVQFFDSFGGRASQPLGTPAVLVPMTTDPVVTGWSGFLLQAVLPVVLRDGTHVLTAQYLGNFSYNSVASTPVTVVVGTRSATQTSLTVDSSSPAFGQVLNFSARIASVQSSPFPTGTVQFLDPRFGILGIATLENGAANLALPWKTGGIQSVVAEYSGDTAYASSQSGPVTITVPSFEFTAGANQLAIPAGSSAAVFLRITPIAGFRSTVALNCGNAIPGSTCSISPSSFTLDGVAGADATFILSTTSPSSSASAVRKAPINALWGLSFGAGLTALAFIALPRGTKRRDVLALVLGSGIFLGAAACGGGGGGTGAGGGTGGNLLPTATQLSSSAVKVPVGSSLVFTAKVASTASSLVGNVTFYDGTTPIGQSAITGGQAQVVVSSLSVGTHSISASYGGDAHNSQSISGLLNEVVTGTIQLSVTATAGLQTQTITMNVLLE